MGCGSSATNVNMSRDRNANISKTNVERTPIQINEDVLHEYLELEYSILEFEKKYVLENYEIKSEQLEQLEQSMQISQQNKQLFQTETAELRRRSLIDPHSVKEFILQKNQTEDPLTNDEENFLDSLNRQEIVEKELESLLHQRNNLKLEVQELVVEGDKLKQLYQRRDDLLDQIFEGQYGSQLENQLEKDLDWLTEQKHHVNEAHFRWKQALTLIKLAVSQLAHAVNKWIQYMHISNQDIETRYDMVAESRNALVSATQNIEGAQRYLPNISLPYCAPQEVQTLVKAISYIFNDMQTVDRHKHALDCYQTTYKRAAALSQWIEQVLDSTIARDLHQLNDECKAKASQLRAERIRLIKQKIKQVTGYEPNMNNEIPFDLRDSGVDSELDDFAAADEQVAQIFEANGKLDLKGGQKSLTPDPTRTPLMMPTLMPNSDLAPVPSNAAIFGKIEQLRNRHRKEIEEFQKAQRLNQARMTQGLRQKLHTRKSRRSRMEMHRRELEALRESPIS